MTRFGIIGMFFCVVMQYIRTGLLSNQADWGSMLNYYQAWYMPPVFTLVGLIIGCVSAAVSRLLVDHGSQSCNEWNASDGRSSQCFRRFSCCFGGTCSVFLS